MRLLFASLLFAGACSSAYADQPYGPQPPGVAAPHIAIASADAKVRAPYDVQVIRDDGSTSPTFAQKDRFYVQGQAGQRYIIRVTNPTAKRVEAVVTVDGLDVIDGESGDLRKRGYIVPAYGEVRIEGFRTSTEDVATFRFSAVDDSYAGQKGKARNVGVIAAAIFEEDSPAEQQIIVADGGRAPTPTKGDKPYDYRDDVVTGRVAPTTTTPTYAPRGERREVEKDSVAKKAPAESRPAPPPPPQPGVGGTAGARAPRHFEESNDSVADYEPMPDPTPTAPKTNRQGLGTEYGETRTSAATYTRFTRNGAAPIAVAELRYNDSSGLAALGINVQPLPDSGEIMTRETADPFPGDPDRFARPPGRR